MNKQNSILNTFLVLCTCYCSLIQATARETIRIHEMKNCPEDVLSTNQCDLSNLTLRVTSTGETLMGGSAYIGRMETITHALISVKNCQSIEQPEEACEKLTELSIQDGCEYITRDGEFWSPIFLGFKPSLVCPLEGVYSVKDVGFDDKEMMKFSKIFGNSILKIRFRAYEGAELKVCGDMAMSLQTVISRGKKRKNKQKTN